MKSNQYENLIDKDKQEDALKTAHFLADGFLETGRYQADESWGPEGILYLAESSYALIRSYEIFGEEKFINAVTSILEALKSIQKPSGGWCLEIGVSGVGFVIDDELRRITREEEDLPPTVAVLKTISDYARVTGDEQYVPMGEKAFSWLMKYYDEEYGSFREDQDNEILKYRSNPRSYHLFSLIGVEAWRKYNPETVDRILPGIIEFVKKTYESYDAETMPLVYGLHAATLVQHCSKEYIEKVIKPKMDSDLVFNERFKIPNLAGGYGHHDGLRGIVVDEAHLRSGAGIIIGMKFFDIYTKTNTYRSTQEYKDLESWIQNMKGDGFYYEYELLPARKKIGYGSPGQYLPIWWILGGF